MDAFTKSFLLMLVLLNPFIMSVYLMALIQRESLGMLARQLGRACLISLAIFMVFAWTGDKVFQDVLQIRFASFLIFGGITFLIIGTRLMMGAGPVVEALVPAYGEVSASIAMPLMVGPGTISASVLAGSRLNPPLATLAIGLALAVSMAAILMIKLLHDLARAHNEQWVHRYAEVVGRVTALFVGSFAIDMILNGTERWLNTLNGVR